MALATAVRAHTDTVIFPGAAILFHNLAWYSGLVSFGLRQVQGNRFPAAVVLVSLGVVMGELVLPRLSAGTRHRRASAERFGSVWRSG